MHISYRKHIRYDDKAINKNISSEINLLKLNAKQIQASDGPSAFLF
jgi:hypothetical protein